MARDAPNYLQHFHTALDMLQPFRLLYARFQAIASALDRLKVGILMLTENETLVHANSRAQKILDKRDGVILSRDGRLQFDAASDATRHGFAEGLTKICAQEDPTLGRQGFVIPKRSG